jgi:YaiO family outer membrane protein
MPLMFADQSIPVPPSQIQPAEASAFDSQFEQARALANAGQPGLALAMYDALVARSPGNADLLLARGTVHARLHHWQEAEADLSAAASAAPAYADVWSALGNMYLWSGQPARALDAFDRLAALRPADPVLLVARARALRALGRGAIPEAAAPAGYRWLAGLSTGRTDAGSGAPWSDQVASVRRYGQHGSLAFEALRAHRFGQSGQAWALDAYPSLWHGAYANLRYQRSAGARLFAQNSGRVELYQAFGNGWEASASRDLLAFPQARVNIYGAGIGKYIGNFYVQLRHQQITAPGSRGTGERLLSRYYYAGAADNFVELVANSGRSDDAASLVRGGARSGGGSLAWVRYWSPEWGVRAGASFTRAADGSERGISGALYRRW